MSSPGGASTTKVGDFPRCRGQGSGRIEPAPVAEPLNPDEHGQLDNMEAGDGIAEGAAPPPPPLLLVRVRRASGEVLCHAC